MVNVKIQMVVISRPHSSYHTNTPTIQLFKKHIARVMKLLFTQSRKSYFLNFLNTIEKRSYRGPITKKRSLTLTIKEDLVFYIPVLVTGSSTTRVVRIVDIPLVTSRIGDKTAKFTVCLRRPNITR